MKQRKNGKRRATTRKSQSVILHRHNVNENERADEILRRAGLLAELTPKEKALAAEWRALSDEEKRQTQEELWNLKPTQSLSQIIIENR